MQLEQDLTAYILPVATLTTLYIVLRLGGRSIGGAFARLGRRGLGVFSPFSMPIVLEKQGRAAEGLSCTECSYDLRSLDITRDCPECGTPIRIAVHESNHVTSFKRRRVLMVGTIILALFVSWVLLFGLQLADPYYIGFCGNVSPAERVWIDAYYRRVEFLSTPVEFNAGPFGTSAIAFMLIYVLWAKHRPYVFGRSFRFSSPG